MITPSTPPAGEFRKFVDAASPAPGDPPRRRPFDDRGNPRRQDPHPNSAFRASLDGSLTDTFEASAPGRDEHTPEDAAARLAELLAENLRLAEQVQALQARVARVRHPETPAVETLTILRALVPCLRDIARAEAAGDLQTGPPGLTGVLKDLRASLTRLGVTAFAEPGDLFDPTIHQALTHTEDPQTQAAVCGEVFEQGYRFADHVLSPARVAVHGPSSPARIPLPGRDLDLTDTPATWARTARHPSAVDHEPAASDSGGAVQPPATLLDSEQRPFGGETPVTGTPRPRQPPGHDAAQGDVVHLLTPRTRPSGPPSGPAPPN